MPLDIDKGGYPKIATRRYHGPTQGWGTELGPLYIDMFGAKDNYAGFDSGPAINLALAAASEIGGGVVTAQPGTYSVDTEIVPKNGTSLILPKGAILAQQSRSLFKPAAGTRLLDFVLMGGEFLYEGPSTGKRQNVALDLDAHQSCLFSDLVFTGYTNAGIIKRKATGTPGGNTVFNTYQNWYVASCHWFDWAQGLDTNYAEYVGDGVTTSFAIPWAFAWPGDICVGIWQNDGTIVKQTLTTDFTVTGGGGAGAPAVGAAVMVVAPTADDLVMIWPKCAANRISPISSNSWKNIDVRNCVGYGHVGVRYIDSESIDNFRISIVAANARAVYINPFSDGNAETDLYNFLCPTITSILEDHTSLRQFYLGAGCENLDIFALNTDGLWPTPVEIKDNESLDLTGTVSLTNGVAAVVGVGTLFTKELQTFGSVKDRIAYQKASVLNASWEAEVDSVTDDLNLTLADPWPGETVVGVTAQVLNRSAVVSYDIHTKKSGTTNQRLCNFRHKTGSYQLINVTYPTGVAFVDIGWNQLDRAPGISEIQVFPQYVLSNQFNFNVQSVGATSFRVRASAVTTADVPLTCIINLVDYAAP